MTGRDATALSYEGDRSWPWRRPRWLVDASPDHPVVGWVQLALTPDGRAVEPMWQAAPPYEHWLGRDARANCRLGVARCVALCEPGWPRPCPCGVRLGYEPPDWEDIRFTNVTAVIGLAAAWGDIAVAPDQLLARACRLVAVTASSTADRAERDRVRAWARSRHAAFGSRAMLRRLTAPTGGVTAATLRPLAPAHALLDELPERRGPSCRHCELAPVADREDACRWCAALLGIHGRGSSDPDKALLLEALRAAAAQLHAGRSRAPATVAERLAVAGGGLAATYAGGRLIELWTIPSADDEALTAMVRSCHADRLTATFSPRRIGVDPRVLAQEIRRRTGLA